MVFRQSITLDSDGRVTNFHNVTDAVKTAVQKSGITAGIVSIYSQHTTCSVITQEQAFDMSASGLETLQQDFVEMLQRISPDCTREGIYLHPGAKAIAFAAEHGEDIRGCHNTDAHLRSALVGRNVTVSITDGKPDLGQFANVYFIDFDTTRPRTRTVQITVLGE